ncbi:hypothetical protein OC844_001306 [Tilletia horrida]|nr:hypothetical protein OC844_001306 [Tilletia horrida]
MAESIYDTFSLLSPPPPYPLPHSSDAVRMRLPDLEDVPEARDFLNRMVIYHHSPAMTIALLASACINLVILVWLLVRHTRLFAQRRLWLFRALHTSDGVVIMPAINSIFCTFTTGFLLLNSACGVLQFASYRRGEPIRNYPLWILFQFIPLWWAFFAQCWASAFGRVPGSHRYELSLRPSGRGPRVSPLCLNSLWMTLPLVITAAIAVLAGRSNIVYQRVLRQRLMWLQEYGDAAALSDELLTSLQVIWADFRRASYYLAIGFILWAVFTFAAAVLYVTLSFRLVIQLHLHLAALLQVQQSRKLIAFVQIDHATVINVSPSDPILRKSINPVPEVQPAPFAVPAETDGKRTDNKLLYMSHFFPSVDPSLAVHEPLEDGEVFKKVLTFYSVQVVAFTCGAIGFTILSIVLSLTLVDHVETNDVASLQGVTYLVASLLAIGAGTMLGICDIFLDKSDAFLALMHGDLYIDSNRAYRQSIPMSPAKTEQDHFPTPLLTVASSNISQEDISVWTHPYKT